MLESGLDVGALRRYVRASQHVRSTPLIILGVLLVNYGTNLFAPTPMQWRFGAPLAFVAVWAALKANETRTGVGVGRADYLVAAGFVFAATNVVLVRPVSAHLLDQFRVQGVWLLVVAIALLGVAAASRDWVLALAGVAIAVTGGLGAAKGHYWRGPEQLIAGNLFPQQPLIDQIMVLVGVAMVLAGTLAYRGERRHRE